MHTHQNTAKHTPTHTHTKTNTHTHPETHSKTHKLKQTYTRTQTYTHTHTKTPPHTHTPGNMPHPPPPPLVSPTVSPKPRLSFHPTFFPPFFLSLPNFFFSKCLMTWPRSPCVCHTGSSPARRLSERERAGAGARLPDPCRTCLFMLLLRAAAAGTVCFISADRTSFPGPFHSVSGQQGTL